MMDDTDLIWSQIAIPIAESTDKQWRVAVAASTTALPPRYRSDLLESLGVTHAKAIKREQLWQATARSIRSDVSWLTPIAAQGIEYLLSPKATKKLIKPSSKKENKNVSVQ